MIKGERSGRVLSLIKQQGGAHATNYSLTLVCVCLYVSVCDSAAERSVSH